MGAGWPAGGEKLVLSQKYLSDQRTEKLSHAWTRKSHLNLLGKTPWGFQDIITGGLFWGPGVPHEFEAKLREKQFATQSFALENSGSGRGHEIYMTRNISIIFLLY